MTGAQASRLKILSGQAHEPDACAPDLTKAGASKRIDALKEAIRARATSRASPRAFHGKRAPECTR